MFLVKLFNRLQARFNRSLTRQSIAHLDARLLNDVGLTADGYQALPQEKHTRNNLIIDAVEHRDETTPIKIVSMAERF